MAVQNWHFSRSYFWGCEVLDLCIGCIHIQLGRSSISPPRRRRRVRSQTRIRRKARDARRQAIRQVHAQYDDGKHAKNDGAQTPTIGDPGMYGGMGAIKEDFDEKTGKVVGRSFVPGAVGGGGMSDSMLRVIGEAEQDFTSIPDGSAAGNEGYVQFRTQKLAE
jgi:hypothetical protein